METESLTGIVQLDADSFRDGNWGDHKPLRSGASDPKIDSIVAGMESLARSEGEDLDHLAALASSNVGRSVTEMRGRSKLSDAELKAFVADESRDFRR